MDLPERLVMTPGQTFSVELPGLGGAGYLWFAEIADQSDSAPEAVVAAVIERGGARQPSSADERPAVGASLPETLLITAKAPGTATVQVAQRRPWESGPPRAEGHTHVVVVSAESDTGETLDEPAPSEDTQPERGH